MLVMENNIITEANACWLLPSQANTARKGSNGTEFFKIDDTTDTIQGNAVDLIEEINRLKRFTEVPLEGIFCDLLWADPMKDD